MVGRFVQYQEGLCFTVGFARIRLACESMRNANPYHSVQRPFCDLLLKFEAGAWGRCPGRVQTRAYILARLAGLIQWIFWVIQWKFVHYPWGACTRNATYTYTRTLRICTAVI